ncbi:MAG: hypothetical protein AB7I41_19615 [Candidatus Sericytochromatia bacterium]
MAPQKLAFHAGHLNERGTDVALWDYAEYNQTLLGNTSLIVSPLQADNAAYERFASHFEVFLYPDRASLEAYLAQKEIDFFYTIVSGEREWLPQGKFKTGVHAVFNAYTPFGDVYAAISDWIVDHRSNGNLPVVPHMVHLPAVETNLRSEWGIPPEAIVFGRHGGFESFDLPFVQDVISNLVYQRPDLWFVFLNTRQFHDHPRILHLPKTTDPVYKTRFINSCDAMLHARAAGESFGLAVGEFSLRNKPVFTWLGGHDKHHLRVLLGKGGIFYAHAEDLWQQLNDFRPQPELDWDCYSRRFDPLSVMCQFKSVFLS